MTADSRHPPFAGHTSSEKWAEDRLQQRRSQAPRYTQRPPNPNITERPSWWPVFWLLCLILVTALMISRQLSTPPVAISSLKDSAVATLPIRVSALFRDIADKPNYTEPNSVKPNASKRWSLQTLRNRLSESILPLGIFAGTQQPTSNQAKTRLIIEDDYLEPRVSLASAAARDQWVMDFLLDEEGIYRMRVWPHTITWTSLGEVATPKQFRLETKMRINPLVPEGYGGFLARYQDEQNYYLFLVDGQGYYKVLLRENGAWSLQQEWTNKAAIHLAGAKTNKIALEDSQNSLRLYANGMLLNEFEPVLPEGLSGFVAGSEVERTAEVDYYGLTLYELY